VTMDNCWLLVLGAWMSDVGFRSTCN